MSWIDFVLIVFFVIGIYSGYKQGFLVATFSLLGIIIGILGGFKLMGLAMIYLADKFDINKDILPYVAFAVVFVAIILIVGLVARLLKNSISDSLLGQLDNAAGAFLGILKTAFLISAGLWVVESLKIELPDQAAKDSIFLPFLSGFAPTITGWISELIPAFRDIFE